MPRSGPGADRVSAARPVGRWRRASLGLALAWIGGLAIARLTGATPVVIVLAAGARVVRRRVRRRLPRVAEGRRSATSSLPPIVDRGRGVPDRVSSVPIASAPVWVEVRPRRERDLACGWSWRRRLRGDGGRSTGRGALDDARRARAVGAVRPGSCGGGASVQCRSTSTSSRRAGLPVGSSASAPGAPTLGGELAGTAGAIAGEIDGVRPWREGDGEKFGALVVDAAFRRAGRPRPPARRRAAVDRPRPHRPPATLTHEAGRGPLGDSSRAARRVRTWWPPSTTANRSAIPDTRRGGALDGARPTSAPTTGAEPQAATLADRSRRPPRRRAARWWAAAATFGRVGHVAHGALGYGPLVTCRDRRGRRRRRRRVGAFRWRRAQPVPAARAAGRGARCAGWRSCVVAAGVGPFDRPARRAARSAAAGAADPGRCCTASSAATGAR